MKWYFFAWISACCENIYRDKRFCLVKKYYFLVIFENIRNIVKDGVGVKPPFGRSTKIGNGGLKPTLRFAAHINVKPKRGAGFTMHAFLIRLVFIIFDFIVIFYHKKRLCLVNNYYNLSIFNLYLSFYHRTKD